MSNSTDTELKGIDLHKFLGFKPNSKRLLEQLNNLILNKTITTNNNEQDNNDKTLEPKIKSFSDSVYFNYFHLGISLVFEPIKPYKPKLNLTRLELKEEELKLISIDLYNHEANLEPPNKSNNSNSNSNNNNSRTSSSKPTFSPFPSYPISITYPSIKEPFLPLNFLITHETTGKDFTQALGEPDRKGGGEGSIGIWVEWTSNGLLVEFASGGLQAWEKGGEAVWRVITIFERGVQMGKDDNDE